MDPPIAACSRNIQCFASRQRLQAPPLRVQGPCCHDGLSARLIEEAGLPIAFMSGFCVAASRLGAPDAGLLSYGEVLDQGRNIIEATRALPLIGDADTGYGNAVNVQRTVRGFAAAGFAGILLEDQVAPKSCGHVRGKNVVGRVEAVSRIRAAADARDEGADVVVIARTDARQAESLDEALWRAAAFADAGADALFIDALESVDEMRAFTSLTGAAAALPKMANNLEGGKTPQLPPAELQRLGFKLVAYPLSLLAVSLQAMQFAVNAIAEGRAPPDSAMSSFESMATPIEFIRSLGTDQVAHSGEDFFSHLTAVQRVLEGWEVETPLSLAGLFHSIYGTEGFQDFSLGTDRRDEVRAIIGERAEFIAYCNCVMDRETLDATLDAPSGTHEIRARAELGGDRIPLTDQQFLDLITVHAADFIEQVERQAAKADERHGWGVGDAWGYRRSAYRRMAEMVGGPALAAYDETWAREPEHTRRIHQLVTPKTKYTVPLQPIAAA